MAIFCSSKALICALLLLTLTPLVLAHEGEGEEEEGEGKCGREAKMEGGKCVCEEEENVMDEKKNCCPAKMSDDIKGELTCFESPENGSLMVAATLIMSFTFLISLQYWTNSVDDEMRKYGWQVISATVSIFTAVLMFQCINGLVEHYIIQHIPEKDLWLEQVVDVIHFLLWYLFTQFALAWASQALKPEDVRNQKMALEKGDSDDRREYAKTKVDLDTDCMSYGVVSAHLTGFAAINAWTGLQQGKPFNSNPFMALVPILMCVLTQIALQRTANMFREKYIAGDGQRDIFEHKWDDQCEEAEDDVLGLTISVMIVNAVRMMINGMHEKGGLCMPNQEQKEESEICEEFIKDGRLWSQILGLFFAGGLFCIMLFFVKLIESKLNPEEENDEEEGEGEGEQKTEMDEIKERFFEVTTITLAMAFSWCTFHANKQILVKAYPYLGQEAQVPLLTTVLALEVTYLGWITIMILDRIYDLPDEWTPPAVDAALVKIIDAIALFIGFAWEQTFDEAVDSLSSRFREVLGPSGPAVTKFIMGAAISTLVFTAWKRYQLPFIIKKGWNFGYVFSLLDIQPAYQKLLEMKGGYLAKEQFDNHRDFELIVEHPKDGRVQIAQRAMSQEGYKAMPGGDDSLQAQNQMLRMRLQQAEQEKMKAQQSLDAFMDNMLSSLKGMNETVTRIEAQ